MKFSKRKQNRVIKVAWLIFLYEEVWLKRKIIGVS